MVNLVWNIKSVQSFHPPPVAGQAGVIQTIYDIVKAHGGELSAGLPSEKVVSKEGEVRPDDPVGRGTEFIFSIPAEAI